MQALDYKFYRCNFKWTRPAYLRNSKFLEASQNQLKGILQYTNEPIVSVDFIGNPHSCLFDSELTAIVGDMVKVVGWYDNEIGYSNRLVDLIGVY
jgi:glyceraldehyde 3-phosphate dehydrogenase